MPQDNQFHLLKSKSFLPLFLTQAIGAFNDNALRNAIALLITYRLAAAQGFKPEAFVQAGTALFVLPYFLFSALTGQLADKYDKARVARAVKLVELAITAFGATVLWLDNAWLDLLALFFAGTLAAFFGPLKYGILPQYVKREELVAGNGFLELGTFVTILLGTMFGGFLIGRDSLGGYGPHVLSATLVGLAFIGWIAALRMPAAPGDSNLVIDWHLPRQTVKLMGYARERIDVFWSVLGASWFWFLGTALLVQMPIFVSDVLHADQTSANIAIGLFTVGIGTGSLFTNRLLNGEISAKYVPVAAILMTIFLIDLYFASGHVHDQLPPPQKVGEALVYATPGQLFGLFNGWRVGFDLFATAFAGGIYAVPLNAIMQHRANPAKRSRVIAANNVINAIFMIAATLTSMVLLQVMTSRGLFLCLGLANALAALWICRLLPQELVASISRQIFRILFRVEVHGIENFHAAGRKTVIIANHTSFLDGPLLSAFLPERCGFAINTYMAKHWWVRPAFSLFDMIPIDPTNPMAFRTLVDELKHGRKIVIFPEGRLTVTGALMKVYEGPAAIAQMAGAMVLPVRIDGAQYSQFSRLRGKVRLRFFPKITLTFLPPTRFAAPDGLKGSALREYQADKLYDVMTDMVFRTSHFERTLFQALLDARATHGAEHLIVEDILRAPVTYNRLVAGSFVLGRRLAKLTHGQSNVAVLLPNSIGCLLAIFGLHAAARVPAMLNFSTGAANMAAACTAAQISTIVTSRRFIEAGNMEADLDLLSQGRTVIYLEDLRAAVGLTDKIYGLFARNFPQWALSRSGASSDSNAPAVILFTSGSEGTPKGVVLSHRNLNANRSQAAARIAFNAQDVVFNALPMFHAFGLTGGSLLPVLAGVRSFQYPSPLHYKIVPELCYDTDATVVFGTDTFLMGYARNAHPYDFFNTRLVVAGAERVKPETREIWMEKFGLRILEGYGATECSPVLAVNTPMHCRYGTVGRLLDDIEAKLEPVPGIDEGGRLMVRGPNVMLGYLRADNPGVIDAPPEGWYDTGDIVKIDAHGFVTILGRAKRFAKVAGEMISLAAVEGKLHSAFPDFHHAVVAVPDAKKGEQLVMFTTDAAMDRKKAGDGLKGAGASDLMVPRNIIALAELPLLGSGKTDYVTLNRLAREQVAP